MKVKKRNPVCLNQHNKREEREKKKNNNSFSITMITLKNMSLNTMKMIQLLKILVKTITFQIMAKKIKLILIKTKAVMQISQMSKINSKKIRRNIIRTKAFAVLPQNIIINNLTFGTIQLCYQF
jgi:hypothetical protein